MGARGLQQAKTLDRPIFLSIGYSACHWCHVMEHESFENPAIAKVMNERFINIKVDREERPDLDQIYMSAVQMMTGRGGWPMSMFLTPDLRPFYGGTYWPPTAGWVCPGSTRCSRPSPTPGSNGREVLATGGDLTDHLQQTAAMQMPAGELPSDLLHSAAASLERVFDHRQGGFGAAPKFPHPMDLQVLLRSGAAPAATASCTWLRSRSIKMAGGGMYDHLGGGFHRYSVDDRWLVPHFEKMLYDNALLAVPIWKRGKPPVDDDYAAASCARRSIMSCAR